MFMVGFDYMLNAEKLSKSANLILIYLVYKTFFAIDMLLPLSLIFGMISTKVFLIKSNALVSFFSLGYSRSDVLKPFVYVSTFIIILYISLHSYSKFASANESAWAIRTNAQYLSTTRDLFFSYQGRYIYIEKLLPLQQRAIGIRVFSLQNNTLQKVLIASSANYQNGYWHIRQADIISKPEGQIGLESKGIKVEDGRGLKILHDFKPKVLDQVYEGRADFAIGDAFDALMLLKDQNVDIRSIKSALYKIFIYPFFVPCIIVIIFFFVPVSIRFLNVTIFSFGAILASLLIWGVLFALGEMSNHKTIPSEVGIVLPIIILFLVAVRQYRKHKV